MGQSSGGFTLDALLVPIGMFGAKVTQKHPPRAGVHATGDAEALGPSFRANDFGHRIVHYLDVFVLTAIDADSSLYCIHRWRFMPRFC
jgi:hypothetical protein